MQEGMGRNGCGVRVRVNGFVKATMESSLVSRHLGSPTYNSSRTCFHRGFNAFIQSDFQQGDHVSGVNAFQQNSLE